MIELACMANPEIDQNQQLEQHVDNGLVESTPEVPAVSEQLHEDTGVSAVPAQPTSLTDDQGQTIAQTVPPEPDPNAMPIPVDPHVAQAWADTKNDEDAKTWLGVQVIRWVKQAIASGRNIIIGG